MFGGLEGPGLLIILVIVLVLFGGSKLPGLARGLGQAKQEFEKASTPPAVTPAAAPVETETVTMTRAELEALLDSPGKPAPAADPRPSA